LYLAPFLTKNAGIMKITACDKDKINQGRFPT